LRRKVCGSSRISKARAPVGNPARRVSLRSGKKPLGPLQPLQIFSHQTF
jgi:hypothetical protein